ncbi:hypothetical protein ACFVUW_11610 [Streptomyces xiamenensis]|uniref:hypothetical protein n=1 Tax=Streptomyces xiamenensis TaxID=408015 RepID=UPI0036E5D485
MRPPGYDEWMDIEKNFSAEPAAADTDLDEGAVDLMRRFARLQPLYKGPIPMQALRLDLVLDTGAVPVSDGERTEVFPVEKVTAMLGATADSGDIRESFHRLHSHGNLLVDDTHETPVVRIVSQRPQRPGDPWILLGDARDTLVPKTCIPAMPGDLDPEEFAALAYVRARMSRGAEPDPQEFGRHEGIGSADRARELFAAVADLAEVKGCASCPTAHLCTRSEPDAAVTR